MYTLKYKLTVFILASLTLSCGGKKEVKKKSETTDIKKLTFVEEVEQAHKKEAFLSHQVIVFDLDLFFGGQSRLSGKFFTKTNSKDALIIYNTGDTLIINNDNVYASSLFKKEKVLRFDAYTWTYFFLLPYKLSDQGAIINDMGLADAHKKAKLTFKENIGDAPDDWYMLHVDKQNNLLDYVAYIVTANKTKEEAEEDPHAIKYSSYIDVDGVPVSTQWEFFEWREGEELSKKLGEATVKNISFINEEEAFFKAPKHFIEI